MGILLDGRKVALSLLQEVQEGMKTLPKIPTLAIVRCGDEPASVQYTTMKQQKAEEIGMSSRIYAFSDTVSQKELISGIHALNRSADGILVQLPLPPHLDEQEVLNSIHPTKDVDGLTTTNAARLMGGDELYAPATAKAVIHIMEHYSLPFRGKHAVIVGRSNILGKPLALMMLNRDATVTICHSHTQHLAEHTLQADILVVAIGKEHYVTPEMVKEGAVVIDVGITVREGKTLGDVHPDILRKASYLSPVPGGIGPVTIASVLHTLLEVAT